MADLNDDYVASVLKKEAASQAAGYSARGLPAFLPPRSKSDAPKPNTRFLKQIMREVDSHNSTLLEKERAESRSRLRTLQRQSSSSHESRGAPRARVLQERKRKRRSHSTERSERRDREYWHSRHKRRTEDSRSSKDRSRHRRRGETERSRSRSRSPRSRHGHRDNRRERHGRGQSTERGQKDLERAHRRRHRDPTPEAGLEDEVENSPYTSDPLEDLIGPIPPPTIHKRGRGAATAGGSAMDKRFQDDYDPTMDAQPESEEDADWDNTVEAYRDRLKWNQQAAERLRSAGFDDDFVKNWENRSTKNEANLKWAKKGGTREWDRGKVLDGDSGETLVKAQWTSNRSKD